MILKKLVKGLPQVLRYSTDTIERKVANLVSIGFTNPIDLISRHSRIISVEDATVTARVLTLTDLGFDSAVDFFTKCPQALSYGDEAFLERLGELEEVGLDAFDAIAKHPKIFLCSQTKLGQTLEFLAEIGVKDPLKLLRRFPRIAIYSSNTITEKIEELRQSGIENPVNVLERAPYITTQSAAMLAGKVSTLRALGFSEPEETIQKNPNLLARADASIARRLSLLQKIIHTYNLNIDAHELLGNNPGLFNLSERRVLILTRVTKLITSRCNETISSQQVARMGYINLESSLLAFDQLIQKPDGQWGITEWIQASKNTRPRNNLQHINEI